MTRYEMNCIVERTARRVLELLKEEKYLTPDKVVTAKEAAAMLSVSVKTIYNLSSDGTIPHTKVRGKLVFTEKSLHEYLHR